MPIHYGFARGNRISAADETLDTFQQPENSARHSLSWLGGTGLGTIIVPRGFRADVAETGIAFEDHAAAGRIAILGR
jgi:hypothetical protein